MPRRTTGEEGGAPGWGGGSEKQGASWATAFTGSPRERPGEQGSRSGWETEYLGQAWDSGWLPAVGYPALGSEEERISVRCGGEWLEGLCCDGLKPRRAALQGVVNNLAVLLAL